MSVVSEEMCVLGEPLAVSYRRVLLERVAARSLEMEQRLAVWRQIAEIDRWLGVEDERSGGAS